MRYALASIVVLAALTSGCASTEGSVDDAPPRGSNNDENVPSVSTSPTDEGESEDAGQDDGQLEFGQSYTWVDGLSVTITKPKPYQPSEYAYVGERGGKPMRFTVTIVNETGAVFDPSMAYMTMQSGNEEAEQIFDSEAGMNGSPSTKLLDGREAKFDIAFAVKNPADLVLEFEPDAGLTYEGVLYVS